MKLYIIKNNKNWNWNNLDKTGVFLKEKYKLKSFKISRKIIFSKRKS